VVGGTARTLKLKMTVLGRRNQFTFSYEDWDKAQRLCQLKRKTERVHGTGRESPLQGLEIKGEKKQIVGGLNHASNRKKELFWGT